MKENKQVVLQNPSSRDDYDLSTAIAIGQLSNTTLFRFTHRERQRQSSKAVHVTTCANTNPAKSPQEKGSRSTERVLAPTSRSSGDDSHQWNWKAHRHLELRQCSPATPDDDTRASMPVQALALEILPTSPTSCCIWLLSLLLYADNKAAEQ